MVLLLKDLKVVKIESNFVGKYLFKNENTNL